MKRIFTSVLVVFMLLLLLPAYAVAGSGDGSGGGSTESLALVNSIPANGAEDVDIGLTIPLTFNKNVVNMSVKDNNSTCFSLRTKDGRPLDIEVNVPDDQVEPDKKRIIYIQPLQPLEGETEYQLVISNRLTAKSGAQLPSEAIVSFRTGSSTLSSEAPESSQEEKIEPKPADVDPPTIEPAVGDTAGEGVAETKKEIIETKDVTATIDAVGSGDPETEPSTAHEEPLTIFAVVFTGVILCAGATYLYKPNKRKRK